MEKNNFHNKEIGKIGEDEACRYLINSNYEILNRNFLTKNGEIDIIAKDNLEYVFIEVKTRMNRKYGLPVESINNRKKNHIINASKYYIYKNSLENRNVRYDVIEVYINNRKKFVNHIKNVFI